MRELTGSIRPSLALKYEAISAQHLAMPVFDLEELAVRVRIDQRRLSRILAKPEYQAVLAARRERVCGEIMRSAQIANFNVQMDALKEAANRISSLESQDLISLINVTGKNQGLQRQQAAAVSVNNQFVIRWQENEPLTVEVAPMTGSITEDK